MSKLFFFFPSSGPGGVQSIIIRLIENAYVSKLDFIVVDYKDGYISSQLKKIGPDIFKKHVFIISSFNEFKYVSDYAFVAFNWQLKYAYKFYKKFNINFIYWDVHSIALEKVLDLSFLGFCFYRQSSDGFLSCFVKESRVLTIDIISKKFIEKKINVSSFERSTVITGIPISRFDDDVVFKIPDIQSGINVVYIGRAVDWKVLPFAYCMMKVVEKYKDYDISCNVYTDDKELFEKLLPDFFCDLSCDVFIFDGFSMSDIIEKEVNRVNLSIGMGTSQFELMLYGIPTLLIPAVVFYAIIALELIL